MSEENDDIRKTAEVSHTNKTCETLLQQEVDLEDSESVMLNSTRLFIV